MQTKKKLAELQSLALFRDIISYQNINLEAKNMKLERMIANGSTKELIEESIPEAEIGKERETIIRLISLLHFIN